MVEVTGLDSSAGSASLRPFRHYGFTAAELDFILNYDIKYRLGRDSESEEE